MKMKLITGCLLLASAVSFAQQVQVTKGPNLANDKKNTMNRMLGGDDNNFYCYRVRSKGKGTSFYVEKYDKASLKPLFSQEVNVDEEGKTKIEDVEYAKGNVFVFRRQYDKKADKMTLFFQVVGSDGKVDPQLKEIITIGSDHFEFVDFDIYPNPSQTKFLIKAAHKANKEDTYKTELILMDAGTQKKLWTKTLNQNLSNATSFWGAIGARFSAMFTDNSGFSAGFSGMYLDDKDNVYYSYTEKVKSDNKEESGFFLKLGVVAAADNSAKIIDLNFDDKYYVKDLQFMKSKDNEIVVGGFLKDVIERKGRDLVKVGIFSFTINLKTNTVAAKTTKFFDAKMLEALESNPKRSRYFKYKMDYILPVGDAVYYIGEQFSEQYVSSKSSTGGSSSSYWAYEYMDVIIAKLNSKGEFEWVQNVPLRNVMRMSFQHVFKQYIAVATPKSIYILCDDNAKNLAIYNAATYVPKKLKPVSGIHKSNFVFNAVSLGNGAITRGLIFKNEDYCFAPIQERNPQFIPPSECEIFVPSKNNELFIYTENKGLDRFVKLKLD
ncbi:MAG TPA: hypothetical protein VN698_11060 [Bacteroidia bacterium]|nr:hypothetical protein [Bacteroidia bacterium]